MQRTARAQGSCLLLLSGVSLWAATACEPKKVDLASECRGWAKENGIVSRKEHTQALSKIQDELNALLHDHQAQKKPDEAEAFTLQVDTSGVTPDGGGIIRMGVKPKDPWHVNLAFPTSMTWKPSEPLQLAEGKFTKTQAKVIDGGGLGFELPIKAAKPGTHKLEGRFKFAVCAEGANCLPVRHNYSIDVEVGSKAP